MIRMHVGGTVANAGIWRMILENIVIAGYVFHMDSKWGVPNFLNQLYLYPIKEYLNWKSPIHALLTSATLWYRIVIAGPILGVRNKIDKNWRISFFQKMRGTRYYREKSMLITPISMFLRRKKAKKRRGDCPKTSGRLPLPSMTAERFLLFLEEKEMPVAKTLKRRLLPMFHRIPLSSMTRDILAGHSVTRLKWPWTPKEKNLMPR